MSSGTVAKIVEALLKLSEDKKAQLTKRHDEHSSWMNNELALIRDLIKHSDKRDTASVASTVAANGRPSEESLESSSSAGSKKRKKTPEVCDTGLSPDLKVGAPYLCPASPSVRLTCFSRPCSGRRATALTGWQLSRRPPACRRT